MFNFINKTLTKESFNLTKLHFSEKEIVKYINWHKWSTKQTKYLKNKTKIYQTK